MKSKHHIRNVGIAFVIPAAIFVIMFSVIPFCWNVLLSFQSWDGFTEIKWAGIANYTKIFANTLSRKSLVNSLLYAFGSTAGGVVLGLALAAGIFRLSEKEGSVFRLILYSPAMLPTAVVGIMFVFFYNPEIGLVNSFLKAIGLEGITKAWLQDSATAMTCIIIVAIWKIAGSVMMLTFAAMQGIPESLYESGCIDGAGFVKQMLHITFPLIKPMILLAAINTLGAQFKSYDLIYTMTQGGPANLTTTVPILMKKTAFTFGSFGEASAMGVIFTGIVAVSILLVRRMLRGESYEF